VHGAIKEIEREKMKKKGGKEEEKEWSKERKKGM